MILSRLKDSLKPWLFSLFPRWYYPYSAGWVGTAGAPLTSTDWESDPYSTTAKTLIDLSTVFGVPAGAKAVLVRFGVNDSDSANTDTYLILSPNNTAGSGIAVSPLTVNDRRNRGVMVVPCDANGDVYYQILASGASTFDVLLEIWGYLL